MNEIIKTNETASSAQPGNNQTVTVNVTLSPDQLVSKGETKNRFIAALLAFFLGGIGIHKFYCGRIGTGFLYLIFCWTFIPLFISVLESLVFLSQKDNRVFTDRYCY